MTLQVSPTEFNEHAYMIPGPREIGQFGRGEHRPETLPSRQRTVEKAVVQPLDRQDLLQMIAELPGMIYRHDGFWNMDFVSEGCLNLTGYRPSELTDGHRAEYAQLIYPLDREAARNNLQIALLENKTYDIVYRLTNRNGQVKWVREAGRCYYDLSQKTIFAEGFITDVTDLKRSEDQVKRQVGRFEALRKIDITIMSSFDLRVTLDVVLEQVITHLAVDSTGVLLFDPVTQMLKVGAWRGNTPEPASSKNLRLGEGLAGRVALERRTIFYEDLPAALDRLGIELDSDGYNSYWGVPLVAKGQLKGILEVYLRQNMSLDTDWITFLEALAGQAAIAVDNATLFDELQRSNIELNLTYDATLEGWSRALELRDRETKGHSHRVSQMTLKLARMLEIPDHELIHVYRGALLHDIGKMGIPDRILLKEGPLDEDEWEIMHQHPVMAYRLMAAIPNLRQATDIPFCHHERWDGSGYPRGLKEYQIPLAARIFAVVDVWDALSSDRPYSLAWPEEKVIEYIRNESGHLFDPQIVDAFMKLYEFGEIVRKTDL